MPEVKADCMQRDFEGRLKIACLGITTITNGTFRTNYYAMDTVVQLLRSSSSSNTDIKMNSLQRLTVLSIYDYVREFKSQHY